VGQLNQASKIEAKIVEAKKDEEKVKEQQKSLLQQVELLQKDDYVAKLARSEYYLSKSGEIIFNTPDDAAQNKIQQAKENQELFECRLAIQKKIWGEEGGYKIKAFSEKIYIEKSDRFNTQMGLKKIFSMSEDKEIRKFIDDYENEEKKLEKYYQEIDEKIHENKEMKKVINAANFILLNLYNKPFLFEKEYQQLKERGLS